MTVSDGDVRWKLARCQTCGFSRMMPADSVSCPKCERELRGEVISAEDARWIIAFHEPEEIVRRAWNLATPATSAAVGLDMTSGKMTVHRWLAEEERLAEEIDGALVLAVCPASRRAELPRLLAERVEGRLSAEDVEDLACEVAVRAALADGGGRFWEGIESQLRERAERRCT